MTILQVYGDYKLYICVCNAGTGFVSEVVAEAIEDVNDVFAQEVLSEASDRPFSSANDRSVIVATLGQLSNPFTTFGTSSGGIVRIFVDDL